MISASSAKAATAILAVTLAVTAILAPPLATHRLDRLENFFSCLARKKFRALALIFFTAIAVRVTLLPLRPVPFPRVHDEFSYLLAADTFTHGRLTNPPHSMGIFFETFHVNQHPTMMSKYPPAQGAALAIGQLLGHPWIGVLLSMAAMTTAVLWALQGWLPAPWAFLGAALLLLRLDVSSYWIDSYWGGAMAGLGGALVLGAAGRIARQWKVSDALIMAVGEGVLANSRPFEGLLFSLPLFLYLLVCFTRRGDVSIHRLTRNFLLPFSAVMLVLASFLLYYDWRITGNAWLAPYMAYDRAYQGMTPAFLWQKPAPFESYGNPQFAAFYKGWALNTWRMGRADNLRHALDVFLSDARIFTGFFLWPEFALPLIALLWGLRDRHIRAPLFQFLFCCGGFLLVAWFQPHYAAPLTATIFLLIAQGMRHLRQWKLWGYNVGIGLSRATVVAAVVLSPFHFSEHGGRTMADRVRVTHELSRLPGKHLVIVEYSTQHDPANEWVYNSAEVDQSKIVWAREIPGLNLAPLLHYFQGRKVWLIQPDVGPDTPSPEPRPYTDTSSKLPVVLPEAERVAHP
jgi:hypothetical protein